MQKGGAAAARVAAKTGQAALTGALLSKVPMLSAALKAIPGLKKVLSTALGEQVLEKGLATAVIGGVQPALEGRAPQIGDFTNALGLVLGFEALRIPASLRKNIEAKRI